MFSNPTVLTSEEMELKYFELLGALYNETFQPVERVDKGVMVSNYYPGDDDGSVDDPNVRSLGIELSRDGTCLEIYSSVGLSPAIYQPVTRRPRYHLLDKSLVPNFNMKYIVYTIGETETEYLLGHSYP